MQFVPNYVNEILPLAAIWQTVHSKGGPLGIEQASCKDESGMKEPGVAHIVNSSQNLRSEIETQKSKVT